MLAVTVARWFQRRWRVAAAVIALAVAGTLVGTRAMGAPSQEPVIPPETAVHYAVKWARDMHPSDLVHLLGDPTTIRGQVMTYEQTHQIRYGHGIGPNEGLWWDQRDRPAWLIVIRGDFGDAPGAKNVAPRQMLIVLDARSAWVQGSTLRAPGHETDTSSLPTLSLPTGPVPTPFATPTPGPFVTPAPTKPAAPPAPGR